MLSFLLGLAACAGRQLRRRGRRRIRHADQRAASKLFAADSTDRFIGSLANPDPRGADDGGSRDRSTYPSFFNYAGFSMSLGSLALDALRDYLYVGNGTSILVFHGASTADGISLPTQPSGRSGKPVPCSCAANDRLYVGDDGTDVKVFSGRAWRAARPRRGTSRE